VLLLLASGYDETFEPAGGWKEAKEDGRAIVVAGNEIIVSDIPEVLADRDWAVPVINFCRRSQSYGNPWGADVGWLNWPAAYLEIYEAIEDVDDALSKERRK